MTEHNLPDKDDAPWLEFAGLSQKEIEDLRKSKKELTQYAKQKFKELMNPEPYDADKFADEERKQRSDRILERYNSYHNLETSGLAWGIITPEQQQAIALQSMVDAMKCEHLNQKYTHIAIEDIEDLIEGLYRQSNEFLNRVKEQKDD